MNSNYRRLRFGAPLLAAAASLAISPSAWSLGLGEVQVESYLNQPLRARIDLITQENDDLASVTAKLASARDYELIGASRDTVSVPIRFSVEDLDGDAYILATSTLPVGEPVVRLIVEVNWSSGRMLREYTLFLDPPTVPEAAPAPRVDQRRSAVQAPAPAAPAAAATEPAAPARPAAVPAGGEEYGPVRNGQTLWSIASDWSRGSGLDINRVMIAIQHENPDAFLNGNINLLKRGAILRMPRISEVENLSVAAANREVAEQEAAFRGRAAASTVASPATPLLAEEAAGTDRQAGSESAAEEAPEPASPAADVAETDAAEEVPQPSEPAATPQDMLELVPPSSESELDSAYGFEDTEEGADAGTDVEALRENLARTEEELINQQQQNAYLEERLRELESQLDSAEDEGVADADMANMEARLQAQRQAEAAAPEPQDRAAEAPWYSRWWVWLIGLLVLAAAIVGWLRSRGSRTGVEAAAATSEDSLRDIKSEAEDVLRVLAEDERKAPSGSAPADVTEGEAAGTEEAAEATPDDTVETEQQKSPGRYVGTVDDAELLDEESSDPEIQLDLARAYISMGDKEAARVILEEVVNNGTETQQEEARKMLDLLA